MHPKHIHIGVTYKGQHKYGAYKLTRSPIVERLVLDFIPSRSGSNPRDQAVRWLRYLDVKSGDVRECRVDSFASWANFSDGNVVECEENNKLKRIKKLLQELKPEELKEVLEPYGLLHT